MMLMRSIIGSLAAVGVIGALAAALPERHAPAKPPATPAPAFGELPKANAGPAAQGQSGAAADEQSLVRLAAYTATRDGGSAVPSPAGSAPAVAPTSSPVRAVRVVGPVTTSAPVAVAAAEVPPLPQPTSRPVTAPIPTAPAASPPPVPPQTLAALPPAQAPQPAGDGRININKASVADLDRLPGGGRIGAAIARRRPYHSVDDLMRKRVVRASIFARIRTAVTVD